MMSYNDDGSDQCNQENVKKFHARFDWQFLVPCVIDNLKRNKENLDDSLLVNR